MTNIGDKLQDAPLPRRVQRVRRV